MGEQRTAQNLSPAGLARTVSGREPAEALGSAGWAPGGAPAVPGGALPAPGCNRDFGVSSALPGGPAIYQANSSFINLPPTKGSKSKKSTLWNLRPQKCIRCLCSKSPGCVMQHKTRSPLSRNRCKIRMFRQLNYISSEP